MNKKAFSLAIIVSMATTGAFASDVVSTSVNNGDKLTKLQKEAIQLTQQQLAQKASQDAQQYEVALNLNEDSTVSLALANNRTAKQSLWDYQAAKATVSATAAGKNPNVSYAWQGTRNHGANTMTGRTVTSKTGQHSFTIKAPVLSLYIIHMTLVILNSLVCYVYLVTIHNQCVVSIDSIIFSLL